MLNKAKYDFKRHCEDNDIYSFMDCVLCLNSIPEWIEKYDELIAEGYNARTAFINIYTERLAEYYEKPPIVVEINDDRESAIVYCLFLCTNSDAGHYVMKLLSLPEYEKWKVFEWQPIAKRLRMGKEQTSFADFC